MTEKINVSVLLDQETLDKITELQKQTGVFSRSAMLRQIVEKGVKKVQVKK